MENWVSQQDLALIRLAHEAGKVIMAIYAAPIAVTTKADHSPVTHADQKAEDVILQDAPWLPLYFVSDPELVSPRVIGIQNNLMGHLPYSKVEVK